MPTYKVTATILPRDYYVEAEDAEDAEDFAEWLWTEDIGSLYPKVEVTEIDAVPYGDELQRREGA